MLQEALTFYWSSLIFVVSPHTKKTHNKPQPVVTITPLSPDINIPSVNYGMA
jgi:hypothetical protein